MNALSIREHLRSETAPFVLKRRSGGPFPADEEFHQRAFESDPERYALESLARDVPTGQRACVIDRLLRRVRGDIPASLNVRLDRVLHVLACSVPTNDMLTVFLALRRRRINRKAISRFMLRYLLNHPHAERLAVRRRQAVVECIEHAVGRNVARACAKTLIERDVSRESYLRRNLLRFSNDAVRTGEIVKLLYQKSVQTDDIDGIAEELIVREMFAPSSEANAEIPRTVTATNRGDIAATLVHLYRGGENAALTKAVDSYVESAARDLPRFAGTVSLVLDVSASTRGYGEREFCCVSQSVAFRLVLERCCSRLFVHQIGGTGNPPHPEGETDLATAVLDALQDGADVIAVVSDGYENVEGGDLARVISALEQMDVTTPIVFCHSKFTGKDSLEYRRPAAELPELEFSHERDFADVFGSLFAAAHGEAAKQFIGEQLQAMLSQREQEITIWTARNGLV